jgi:SAM-dependent methyltransferase
MEENLKNPITHSIAVDEEGYFVLNEGIRLTDEQEGHNLLKNLTVKENHAITTLWTGVEVIVEAFDKPLVARQIFKTTDGFDLLFPYGFRRAMITKSLVADAWDRFHGLTEDKIPFVMSRPAQAEFFNLLEDYDDDTVTINGQVQEVPPFYIENSETKVPEFWQQAYEKEGLRNWDLDGPHPALEPILPQIKIVKSRVVNFGCGRGHDAAFMAKKGHIVTGIDLSETAIEQGKKIYGNIPSLTLEVGNVFQPDANSKYDVVLEHTLFCALPPEKRKELVLKWHQALDVGGYLLGVFFVSPQRSGPPYGSSEWELSRHLEKYFRLLYWKRWAKSPERRIGTELVVFAQKK